MQNDRRWRDFRHSRRMWWRRVVLCYRRVSARDGGGAEAEQVVCFSAIRHVL